jgi:protein-S-isoprenylcysteine O-methyltransferase Ste14
MNIGGIILLLSGVLFGASGIGGFFYFLFVGGFGIIEFDLKDDLLKCLLFDSFLSLIFFIQHSLFVRKFVKSHIIPFLPDKSYGLFFSTISGLALWIVLIFWQESNLIVIEFSGTVSVMVIRFIFFSSFVFMAVSYFSLKEVDMIGNRTYIKSLWTKKRSDTKKKNPEPEINMSGPYGLVRHPLYLSWIIYIWFHPIISADRLLMCILWTFWIIAGTLLEERDLAEELGKAYKEYKKKVNMLIPYIL